jgi:adenosylcobinamide kinase/adenosylcobinamide-phosphate guanylyltransferase
MQHLILGGARSGKSGYAEQLAQLAETQSKIVVFVATAQKWGDEEDVEMQQRIKQHQLDRPKHWTTLTVKTDLASIVLQASEQQCLVIDCLTLWLLTLQHHQRVALEVDQFLEALHQTKAQVICVSNEIGMGVVPLGKLTRQYVDDLGRLHQKVAKIVPKVTLMVAGIPMKVK